MSIEMVSGWTHLSVCPIATSTTSCRPFRPIIHDPRPHFAKSIARRFVDCQERQRSFFLRGVRFFSVNFEQWVTAAMQ